MSLDFVLAAMGVLVASGLAALVLPLLPLLPLGRIDGAVLAVGTAGAVAACLLGLAGAGLAMADGSVVTLRTRWSVPIGEIHLGIDALSAFFLLCVFLVALLSAVYGAGYLKAYSGKKRLAPPVAFFNLLVASMVGVVLARDGVLFLVAWELMSIASYFLVTFEDEREEVRRAGMTYLVASHAGTALVLVLFCLLARHAGSFSFAVFATTGGHSTAFAGACFGLALMGFGTKAGFWPVHVWLPDAHPAAPSHVSALMSGVMIKMGIYGFVRALAFLGPIETWWGVVVVVVGAVSCVAGVLHALAQHDLKRLLAYHSVENVGIIALGLGVGMLGQAQGNAVVATLGYAGGLLHVLNHGLFKGLLFHGAGSILHGTGTRRIDTLGGLGRRMPVTALAFLVGAVAISGLPPLNGFVSEWLVYVGAFRGAAGRAALPAMAAIGTIASLALVGGLAAACFVKAYGILFLGEPRSEEASKAHEAPAAMRLAMIAGALACAVLGLFPGLGLALVARAATATSRMPAAALADLGSLWAISRVAAALLVLAGALALARFLLLRGREVRAAATWGCGYPAPTPRMQYTASSFAQPVLEPFSLVLPRHVLLEEPRGFFPEKASHEVHPGDLAGERLLVPLAGRVVQALGSLRFLQQGRLQLYLVYVLVTLIAMLVWQLAGSVLQGG